MNLPTYIIYHLRTIIAPLLLLFASMEVAAFDHITEVRHFRTPEGLHSERVYSIIQSADGAVWMGTRAGVERYNGSRISFYPLLDTRNHGDFGGRVIKVFAYDIPSSRSSASARHGIYPIGAFDNSGRVYRYDPLSDSFRIILRMGSHVPGSIQLNDVCMDAEGGLLMATSQGLWRYRAGRLTLLLPNHCINAIHMDKEGTAVMAASSGAFTWHPSHGSLVIVHGHNLISVLATPTHYYFGSNDADLLQYDIRTHSLHTLADAATLHGQPIRALSPLSPLATSAIAIGIDGAGVYRYDFATGDISPLISTDEHASHHINGNGVYALHLDSYGTLWCGSYTGGVAAIHFGHRHLAHYLHERGNTQTLRNNNVNSVAEAEDGGLWFATDEGVSILHPTTGLWTHSSGHQVAVHLTPLPEGGMAAGTYGHGILLMDSRGQVTRTLTKSNSDLTSNIIFNIMRHSDGSLWVATLDGGVLQFDPSFNLLHRYPVSVAFALKEAPDGRVGVATADGLSIIDPSVMKPAGASSGRSGAVLTDASRAVSRYATSSEMRGNGESSYITAMSFNTSSSVWLGTEGGGMMLYDLKSRRVIRHLSAPLAIPSDHIYSIQPDRSGNLIVGTGAGLARCSAGGDILALNNIDNATREYNKSAATLLRSGDIILGSVYGAVRISPSTLNAPSSSVAVGIVGAYLESDRQLSHSAEEGEGASLRFMPVKDGKLHIDYDDRKFTVRFESVSILESKGIAYQYMLAGFDRGWSRASDLDFAEYKNVPPGRYTFTVRCVRAGDGTVMATSEIVVVIGGPWWQSWWAWTLYTLLAILFGVMIYRYQWLGLQRRHDEDKIRFFINAAHDLRTPVSLVMAPVFDLQQDQSLSPRASRLVHTASSAISKLNEITSQLLEFEKFDSGRRSLHLQSIDIISILRMEASCFADAFSRKGIRFSCSLPDGDLCMKADRYLLETMLDNLLSNAYKYTPAGGEVSLRLSSERRHLHITLQDTGIGIPRKERRKVMRGVFRARNAMDSNIPGTGFGLLQVRRIVRMLKGRIEMRSREGEGTTFHITFPRSSESVAGEILQKLTTVFVEVEQPLIQPNINASITPPSATLPDDAQGVMDCTAAEKSHSLMIVEDNDDLRVYLTDMFGSIYAVTSCASADEALVRLESEYPDLILSDVMMPGMQGDEFCRKVKSNHATSGIPVILLTAKSDHLSTLEGLSCGADDYVAKPFNSDILRLKVSGALANRDRLRQYLLSTALQMASTPSSATTDTIANNPATTPAAVAAVAPQDTVVTITSLCEDHHSPSSATSGFASSSVAESASDFASTSVAESASDSASSSEAVPALESADRAFIDKATSIVLERMAEPEFDIDMLCREMAMSRTLFFSRLKSLTGRAPQDFIRMLKLECAAKCLREGLSITATAENTGFVNVKYFSTLFKKHYGVSPSAYTQSFD